MNLTLLDMDSPSRERDFRASGYSFRSLHEAERWARAQAGIFRSAVTIFQDNTPSGMREIAFVRWTRDGIVIEPSAYYERQLLPELQALRKGNEKRGAASLTGAEAGIAMAMYADGKSPEEIAHAIRRMRSEPDEVSRTTPLVGARSDDPHGSLGSKIGEAGKKHRLPHNSPTLSARELISAKIRQLSHEGYAQKQAVAIAFAEARRAGYRLPKRRRGK